MLLAVFISSHLVAQRMLFDMKYYMPATAMRGVWLMV